MADVRMEQTLSSGIPGLDKIVGGGVAAGRALVTVREMKFGDNGIWISDPLSRMEGVLTGVPNLVGDDSTS